MNDQTAEPTAKTMDFPELAQIATEMHIQALTAAGANPSIHANRAVAHLSDAAIELRKAAGAAGEMSEAEQLHARLAEIESAPATPIPSPPPANNPEADAARDARQQLTNPAPSNANEATPPAGVSFGEAGEHAFQGEAEATLADPETLAAEQQLARDRHDDVASRDKSIADSDWRGQGHEKPPH